MGAARDGEALIRELLAGVAEGWSYAWLKGWWMSKRSNEAELVGWLREYGARLVADGEIRAQLVCLADLERGDLAAVAAGLVKGWEPQVEDSPGKFNPSDESEEWFDRGNELYELGNYEDLLVAEFRQLREQQHSSVDS